MLEATWRTEHLRGKKEKETSSSLLVAADWATPDLASDYSLLHGILQSPPGGS